MAVTVGKLVIDIAANTASFTTEMGKAGNLAAKSANDIKRSLEKVTVAAAAMATALIVSTAGVVRSALDQVDALGKAAQAAGTTAETLSTLEYAAKLSNVENEQLVKGLEKLSLAAFKAQGGNVQLEKIFGRLGITIMDANGHLKDSGILLEEMAPKFSAMADGAGKTALAQAIFGKAGASLIPMLNQYGEEQARVNDEAHRFGLVLSQSTVDIAMKAHDNLDRLTSVLKGMGFSLLAATLPALDSLLQKLINIAATSDLQGLAKKFGGEVTKAVNMLGDALDFAVKHATALKIALEAIAAVKIASIAIPIVADLAGGGLANVGAGIDKATLGMLGLQRAANALPTIGAKIGGIASGFYKVAEGATVAEVAAKGMSVGFGGIATRAAATTGALRTLAVGFGAVAAEEGILSATTFTMGTALTTLGGRFLVSLRAIPALLGSIAAGAANVGKAMLLAALSNPWTAAALAIAGAVAALYIFRDATFSLGGSTYELRDTWNAAWILMKEATAKVVEWFKTAMQDIKDAWSGVVDWIKSNPIGKFLSDDLSSANDRLAGYLSAFANKIIPQGFLDALKQAKAAREAAERASAGSPSTPTAKGTQKEQADTSGLGKPRKDPYTEEIDKLDLAIEAQQNYLKVIDSTPDEIQKVVIAEKAHAVVLEVNRKMLDEFGHGLTGTQGALLEQKVTLEETLKALREYGQGLVNQQHSTELSIQQAQAMALAYLQGDDAVRRATVGNELLALSFNKTTAEMEEFLKRKPELEASLNQKANTDLIANTNREIYSLDQESAAQDILRSAILGTIEVQRQAEIDAKTYALNQQIATESVTANRLALELRRNAIELDMRAQQQANDLSEARNTLGGPTDQFALQEEHLQNLIDALEKAQGGYLTYGQQLQVAAAQQDIFDKTIDETVQSMIRFGDARDGIDAFFLDMQKQAQSTASIVFDALHSAFDKISENLSQLVTGGKTSFAKMFEDIGRSIVQADIKKYLQEGLAKLAPHIPGLSDILGKETTKNDGSSEQTALWVQLTSASSAAFAAIGNRSTNELTPLIGPNPDKPQQAISAANQIAQHPPVNIGSALSDLPSFLKILGGLGGQKSPFGESLGLPTGKGNELTDLIGAPKGTAASPIYTKNVGGSGGGGGSGLGSLLGGSGSGGFGGDESEMDFATDEGIGGGFFSGLLSKLGGLFGGASGGSEGLSSIFGMLGGLIPHAEGGPVTPSSAYLVGEKGPEILTGVSGNITSHANSMRALSSSSAGDVYYSIDARGTDPVLTEQRTRAGIMAAHNSAINKSAQLSAERMKRLPQRY